MRFTIILDSTTPPYLLNNIKSRINGFIDKKDIDFDEYILLNGNILDGDSNLLITILSNESGRCPVVMDLVTAQLYPEIIKSQQVIIALYNNDTPRYVLESLISMGAFLDVFCDMDNKKSNDLETNMLIIDLSRFYILPDYYKQLYMIYKNEHVVYPTTLLSRDAIQQCKGNFSMLVEAFEDRNNKRYSIGWSNTAKKIKSFKKYESRFIELQNSAIKTFSDERLRTSTEDIVFNPKQI